MKLLVFGICALASIAGAAVTAASLVVGQTDGSTQTENEVAAAGPNFSFAMQMANASDPARSDDCFNVEFVQGYAPVDRDTIRLDLGNRRAFEVDLSGPRCDELAWTQRLALESTPGSWICVGTRPGQGDIYFRDPATRQRLTCHIENVRRLPERRPHS